MSNSAPTKPEGTHRVKVVKNPNFVHNGKMAYGHALRKFGFKPTLDYPFEVLDEMVHGGSTGYRINERLHGRAPGVAQRRLLATDDQGQTGEVNAQDVNQVWSTELPKSTLFQGKAIHHTVYDHAKSQTFKPSAGQTWHITYGDGSTASGNVGTDVVSIGGINVKNQSVELASKLSPSFAQGAGDGLLGLAFGSINTVQPTPAKTPVENMILQSAIQPSMELFTAYLGSYKDKNDPDKGQSFYTFGYIDNDVVASTNSQIWYTNVDNSNGFWQFKSQSFSVNGETHNTPNGSAIADTGTTLAMVSDQACKSIYAAIPGAKFSKQMAGYIFPTNTPQSSLPDVQFDIGGKSFTVQKEDLAYVDAGNGFSYGGIQSRGDLPFNIYGDVFLKSVYAIFDVGNKRFGCVQRIEPSNSTSNAACANGTCRKETCQNDACQKPIQPVVAAVLPPSAPNAAAPAPAVVIAPTATTQAPSAQPPASG